MFIWICEVCMWGGGRSILDIFLNHFPPCLFIETESCFRIPSWDPGRNPLTESYYIDNAGLKLTDLPPEYHRTEPPYYLLRQGLLQPGTHGFGYIGYVVSSKGLTVSTFPSMGLQMCTTMPRFLCGC